MRVRQVIEKEIDESLESNTKRDPVTNEAVQIRVPVMQLVLVALEIFLDIRDILLTQAVASGQVKAVTHGGIEIPGQPHR